MECFINFHTLLPGSGMFCPGCQKWHDWDVLSRVTKTAWDGFVRGVKKWHGMFCPRMFCPTFAKACGFMGVIPITKACGFMGDIPITKACGFMGDIPITKACGLTREILPV